MDTDLSYYHSHLTDMSGAAGIISSEDVLFLGSGLSISGCFLDTLAERSHELHGVTLLCSSFLASTRILFDPDCQKAFNCITFFADVLERMAEREHNMDFAAVPFGSLVAAATQVYGTNTVCVEVCPPNENGKLNTGVFGACFTPEILRSPGVTKRIAIVNRCQPRAVGEPGVTEYELEDFDLFVENDHDIVCYPPWSPSRQDDMIAAELLPHIHDGDAVLVEPGAIGSQLVSGLSGKSGLRLLTTTITDAFMTPVSSGAVVSVRGTSAFGSRKLYDWLWESGVCEMIHHTGVTLPESITALGSCVTVSEAQQVDLTGQVCMETRRGREFDGVGTRYAFVAGAVREKGGRSFVCLHAAAHSQGELRSNILPSLPEGAVVTIPRYLIQYVVTEYGAADLYLRSNRDRARALLAIAHPQFRESLRQEAGTSVSPD